MMWKQKRPAQKRTRSEAIGNIDRLNKNVTELARRVSGTTPHEVEVFKEQGIVTCKIFPLWKEGGRECIFFRWQRNAEGISKARNCIMTLQSLEEDANGVLHHQMVR